MSAKITAILDCVQLFLDTDPVVDKEEISFGTRFVIEEDKIVTDSVVIGDETFKITVEKL